MPRLRTPAHAFGHLLTPSLAISQIGYDEAPSELQLSNALRKRKEAGRLPAFRDVFITRVDFQAMAKLGLQLVRVPFGAWEVADGLCGAGHDAGYIHGRGLSYLDDAVAWAAEFGLRVVLDLHGACGGQSGAQASGDLDPTWTPERFNAVTTPKREPSHHSSFAKAASVLF